jgi:hypothetical protein
MLRPNQIADADRDSFHVMKSSFFNHVSAFDISNNPACETPSRPLATTARRSRYELHRQAVLFVALDDGPSRRHVDVAMELDGRCGRGLFVSLLFILLQFIRHNFDHWKSHRPKTV